MAFKPGSYRSKYYDEYESEASPFATSFLDGGNFLDSSRGYRAKAEMDVSPVPIGEGIFDAGGTKALVGGALAEQQAEMDVANSAMKAWSDLKQSKLLAAGAKDAISAQAGASKTGSVAGMLGSIGGTVVGALI
jgi:hypothetical protein